MRSLEVGFHVQFQWLFLPKNISNSRNHDYETATEKNKNMFPSWCIESNHHFLGYFLKWPTIWSGYFEQRYTFKTVFFLTLFGEKECGLAPHPYKNLLTGARWAHTKWKCVCRFLVDIDIKSITCRVASGSPVVVSNMLLHIYTRFASCSQP